MRLTSMSRLAALTVAALAVLAVALTPQRPAVAQQTISLIRDAEIEHALLTLASPIFAASGVNPRAVSFHLVNDRGLNAFVMGGQNIYFNTGLIVQARSVGELIGVMAHELGHIAGGHLARGHEEMEAAQRTALIATLLGIGAAAASGDGRAGIAVMGGGLSAAERGFLRFTRAMESSADQAAMAYLDRARLSARGMLAFLERMEAEELVPEAYQSEYVRTHPLTRDRVDAVRAHVARSAHSERPMPAEFDELFARMRAKILGFMQPQQALRDYAADDPSFAARYARAIATYKRGDPATALAALDGLLAEEPNNPFLHELQGQIYLETGRLAEARGPYERANALYPNNPLLLTALAQTRMEGGEADLRAAVEDLQRAVRYDRAGGAPMTWRLLATAHGRVGDLGQAHLAMAEEALARRDAPEARQQAQRAIRSLPEGSSAWLRAQDILATAER